MRKVCLLLLLAVLALPASATVRYVDANRPDNSGNGLTWATAHKYLQNALSAASDGDQIWVARGIYKPTDNAFDRDASFVMKEGVAIYGGFTSGQMNLNDRNSDPADNGTVLSGDIDGSGTAQNNSMHIVYNAGNALTGRAVLDGFTLSGGSEHCYNNDGLPSKGAAVYNDASSPSIIRCFFIYNHSDLGGAIYNKESSPEITDCTFEGNFAGRDGGGIYNDGGSPVISGSKFFHNWSQNNWGGCIYYQSPGPGTLISNCEFENNTSFRGGGGIHKKGGQLLIVKSSFKKNGVTFSRSSRGGAVQNSGALLIEDCQFVENNGGESGGAIESSSGDCRILNSKFIGNSSRYGGGISVYGNPRVSNCLFQSNSAAFGGAVNAGQGSIFSNCSFLDNSASGQYSASNSNPGKGGAAIYSPGGGTIDIANCVFWKNHESDTFNYQGSESPYLVKYTLSDASSSNYTDGGNNIISSQSPFISDTDARLRPGSPAIDAGLNSANSTTTDLAGNQRIINGTIDMGAYEFSNPTDFAITGVSSVNCQELSPTARQLTFTPVYKNTDGSPITFSVFGELADTQAPGPYSLRLYKDNPTITLVAKQGNGDPFRYTYNWLANCGTTPPASKLSITGVSGVKCEVLSPTARQLTFTPTYAGADGSPITFGIYNEMPRTQAPGPYSLRLYTDNPTIMLTAKQGDGEEARFWYDWLAACPAPSEALAITGVSQVKCEVISPTARQLSFVPVYRGGDGSPIAFSVSNEMPETPAPGPYSLRLYIDNSSISLTARQGGGKTHYQYDWVSGCNNDAAARMGVAEEPGSELQVILLGNPVVDGVVTMEVRGAGGQPLAIQLLDMNGRVVDAQQVKQAEAVERHSLKIGQQAGGVLLLRANTPSESQTVKVLNVR